MLQWRLVSRMVWLVSLEPPLPPYLSESREEVFQKQRLGDVALSRTDFDSGQLRVWTSFTIPFFESSACSTDFYYFFPLASLDSQRDI